MILESISIDAYFSELLHFSLKKILKIAQFEKESSRRIWLHYADSIDCPNFYTHSQSLQVLL